MSEIPPRASSEVWQRHFEQLKTLLRTAQRDGVDLSEWLMFGLAEVAAESPEGVEALVQQRPGSWEAEALRQFVGPLARNLGRSA